MEFRTSLVARDAVAVAALVININSLSPYVVPFSHYNLELFLTDNKYRVVARPFIIAHASLTLRDRLP